MKRRSIRRLAAGRSAAGLCIALAWLLLAAGAPHAAAAERDVPPAQAEAALESAVEALAPDPGAEPDREATLALAELAAALPALTGPERRRARALLARPTDGNADPVGHGYTVPAEHVHSIPSPGGSFCVTWVSAGADAPDPADTSLSGVPDYVEAIGEIAEHSWLVQIGQLGWRRPVPDAREECGVPGQTDIYLADLGESGIFGYQAIDPGQGKARSKAGYLVIDNDFRPRQFPGFAHPLDAARVTVAHELNHLLQIAYSAYQDPWMLEATATWMEEIVHPQLDDWLRYLPRFARNPGVPITALYGGGGLKVYGSAVWNHWLSHRYRREVIRRAWGLSGLTRPPDFAVRAYGRSITWLGGAGFASEFVRFATATAEWRAGVGGFPKAERYPRVRRQGRLPAGSRKSFRLHHTGYRLLRVPPVRARALRLRATVPRNLQAGIALVGRRGGPVRGRVVRRVRMMPRGGTASVILPRPRRFDRITAVVTNSDARARGRRFGDWLYTRDGQRFELRLRALR